MYKNIIAYRAKFRCNRDKINTELCSESLDKNRLADQTNWFGWYLKKPPVAQVTPTLTHPAGSGSIQQLIMQYKQRVA
ncbi:MULTISPECIES: hypothetical protein [unclassified Pseudoalteromonas]|uniref:hypothetical protein n=1 Tax=unclassified Pseudoalteromonas TaxID=194690 RepID=UPI00301496B0